MSDPRNSQSPNHQAFNSLKQVTEYKPFSGPKQQKIPKNKLLSELEEGEAIRRSLASKSKGFNFKESNKKFVSEDSAERKEPDYRDDRVGGYVACFRKELSESIRLPSNPNSSPDTIDPYSKSGVKLDLLNKKD